MQKLFLRSFRGLALFIACALPLYCGAADFSGLERLDFTAEQGDIGIGVVELRTGASWYRQADKPFPMQSVYKLPIAIAVLRQVDSGDLSLDQNVTIRRRDISPWWSPITKDMKGDRKETTLRELIVAMAGLSDNTAADMLIDRAGGARRITAILQRMGIRDVRVDRNEKQLQTESVGLKRFTPALADDARMKQAIEAVPPSERQAALERYLNDVRDTATPRAMTSLLIRLAEGELLSPASTRFLMQVLTDSPTGQKRLKAGLPAAWTIAHKTGTGADVLGRNSATNDVGIVASPNGERYAIAVFIAGSRATLDERETLIARVAAAVTQGGKTP